MAKSRASLLMSAVAAMCLFFSGGLAARVGNVDTDQSIDAYCVVDAGSSGSKVFLFYKQDRKTVFKAKKILTACNNGQFDLQGVSALAAYDFEMCNPNVSFDGEPHTSKVITNFSEYRVFLEQAITRLKADLQGETRENVTITNAQQILMMATAGMRLVSETGNQKAWGEICSQKIGEFKIAPIGDGCGTIPGTDEAYYEFLVDTEKRNRPDSVPFVLTAGGASIQIAMPLSQEDLEKYESIRFDLQEGLEEGCKAAKLLNGDQMPIFSKSKTCLDDFVAIKDINASHLNATSLLLVS